MSQEKEPRTLFLTLGVYFSLIAGSICHGMYTSAPLNEILTDAVISLLLAYVLDRFVKYIHANRGIKLQDKGLFVVLFFLVNMLIAVANQELYGYLWILPVVMVAISSGVDMAIVVFAALSAQNILLHSDVFSARELLVVAMYGFICIWLMIQRLSKKILPYIAIIMLTVDCVLQILRYRFSLSAMRSDKEYIILEAVSVFLLFLFICGYIIYRERRGETVDEESTGMVAEYVQDGLSGVLEADYELLLRLQNYSGQLFVHSMRISSVSAQAARYMNGNVRLAQAGGLYHEIGRITGEKEYLEAGIKLMDQYEFPEELTAVIKQQSLHYGTPQSLEAAIVMFTDNIISTDEYLRRSGKRKAISDERLVNMVFESRISKGSLEESGMTKEDLDKLRQFYVNKYFMSDKEKDTEKKEG